MKTITLKQLRRNPRSVTALLRRHKEVFITVRGKTTYVACRTARDEAGIIR